MKTARCSSSQPRRTDTAHRLLRRLVFRIPVKWRGAVMLTVLTLFLPVWITAVIWEAVLGNDAPSIEASTPQT